MTTKVSIERLTLKELVELQQEITVAMARRRIDDLADLRSKVTAMVSEAGFDLEDVVGTEKRKSGKRAAAAVKYRNPKNPDQTWTGRGRKPNWFVDAVKKGQKAESFAV